MMTVHELSALTGVSIRALQYYDRIGLLPPVRRTEAGYRLYDDGAMERLQQILLFRTLEFPLREIRRILDSPDFDRRKALTQQIELLRLKKDHLEALIAHAQALQTKGEQNMDFTAFDTERLEAYAAEAKKTWGRTEAYGEYEKKAVGRTADEQKQIAEGLMQIFRAFGQLRTGDPASEAARAQVGVLQAYITEHYYTCTDQILAGLGAMYAGGGAFTENIDRAGGEGTAAFVNEAIRARGGSR